MGHAAGVLAFFISSAAAFGQTDSLSLSSGVVSAGGTASLNLSLSSSSGGQPAGIEWTFAYSTSDIMALSATAGTAATAAGKSLSCAGGSGSYTCFLTGLGSGGLNANPIPNGVVAVLTVTLSPTSTGTIIGVNHPLGSSAAGSAIQTNGGSGTVTVVPLTLASFNCNPSTLASGASTTCTLNLNLAPAVNTPVTLSDSNAPLSLPAAVTVPAGTNTATFIATAGNFTITQTANVNAILNGSLETTSLNLVAPTVVSGLACPSSVNAGASATCTITLNQAAPNGGSVVALSANNVLLTVPASVTVTAGAAAATFAATAGSVTTTQPATINAVLGSASQSATLSLIAQVLVSSLACNNTTLAAGKATGCTLTLSVPAPTGGITVPVSANSPALTVPASVYVQAGSSTAKFAATATTTPPDGGTTATVLVSATLNGALQSEPLTLVLCPCSLWPSTAQPVNPASTNQQAIEVGMQFTSSVPEYVTGVRFFKASTNKGAHVGNLWNSTGTNLATVAFTNETASGWQTAYFPSPVAIAANTTYVISYHAPQGHNAADSGSFTTAVSHPPVQALADGQNGPNGVYVYGSSAFPTTGAAATNYWVDVIMNTARTIGVAPPVSVWTATAAPATPAAASAQPLELGLKFLSDVPGYITGVRFYKSAQNLGPHYGYLWTSTGTLLASVRFTRESASGWQQANFATPVAISANTPYVVSYWSPQGYYADDTGYFATAGVTNQMLYAPTDGQYGPNGSFATTNTFPASSSSATNYWVDLVFSTAMQ